MKRSFERSSFRTLVTVTAAACVCSGLAFAEPPRPGDAGPPAADANGPATRPAAQPLQGTFRAFNVGPNGAYESLLLAAADGRNVQVNFPPHLGDAIVRATTANAKLTLTATPAQPGPEDAPGRSGNAPDRSGNAPDHPVFDLASVTLADGQTLNVPQPGERPVPGEPTNVEGTIKRLNYARDGRVNGAILTDDTFVHVGPKGAQALGLAEGQTLVADGPSRPTASGVRVVNAETVNGTPLPRPPKPKDGPKEGPKDGPHERPRP